MKILHTVPSFGAGTGGVATCVFNLVRGLNEIGVATDIATFETSRPIDGGAPFVHYLKKDVVEPLGRSRNFAQYIAQTDYDVYHANGLWRYVSHLTCRHARKQGKACVVTPHGMLYPADLIKNYWKKRLALALLFGPDIKHASCIHVTCTQELEYVRELGFKTPALVIPNAIDFDPEILNIKKSSHPFRIGCLGRIHPRKNFDRVVKAWAALGDKVKDGELVIIGSGLPEHEKPLRDLVESLHLKNVRFLGFLQGMDKFRALADLSALFVPSVWENFGMIIPEALSVRTPVMASTGTPWESLNTARCGWWGDNSVEALKKLIADIHDMSSDELSAMGERGLQLVLNHCATPAVAQMMAASYAYLAGNGPKPPCWVD